MSSRAFARGRLCAELPMSRQISRRHGRRPPTAPSGKSASGHRRSARCSRPTSPALPQDPAPRRANGRRRQPIGQGNANHPVLDGPRAHVVVERGLGSPFVPRYEATTVHEGDHRPGTARHDGMKHVQSMPRVGPVRDVALDFADGRRRPRDERREKRLRTLDQSRRQFRAQTLHSREDVRTHNRPLQSPLDPDSIILAMPATSATASVEDNVRAVETTITYVAPGSFVNRRFVAPGIERNTGRYEAHRVLVRDGRSIAEHFSLDVHGFVLARRLQPRPPLVVLLEHDAGGGVAVQVP